MYNQLGLIGWAEQKNQWKTATQIIDSQSPVWRARFNRKWVSRWLKEFLKRKNHFRSGNFMTMNVYFRSAVQPRNMFGDHYSWGPNKRDCRIRETGGQNVKMLIRETGQIRETGGKPQLYRCEFLKFNIDQHYWQNTLNAYKTSTWLLLLAL